MDAMQQMVFDVLGRPELDKINFKVEGTMMLCIHFWGVRQGLRDNVLRASHEPSLGQGKAKYSLRYNRFKLGFTSTGGSTDREALIVHESTHAALDLCRQNKRLRVSEGIAYLAQVLYFYHKHRAAIDAGTATPTFGDPILAAAWEVSKGVRTSASLSRAEMQPLYDAIDASALYAGRLDDVEQMDG